MENLESYLAPYRDHLVELEETGRITSLEHRRVQDAVANRLLHFGRFLMSAGERGTDPLTEVVPDRRLIEPSTTVHVHGVGGYPIWLCRESTRWRRHTRREGRKKERRFMRYVATLGL